MEHPKHCWLMRHQWFESDRIWMWRDSMIGTLLPFHHGHTLPCSAVTLITYHCSKCRRRPKQVTLQGHLPGGEPDEARSRIKWSRIDQDRNVGK